jgi:hypothetical protein
MQDPPHGRRGIVGRVKRASATLNGMTRSGASRDLELTRSSGDRRLYVLEGIGTLRLEGLTSRRATVEAVGKRWRLARRGIFRRGVSATDETGAVAGEFEPRTIRRGGVVRWAGRELALRPASVWRERYALADGAREFAFFHGKGWGRRRGEARGRRTDRPGAGALCGVRRSWACRGCVRCGRRDDVRDYRRRLIGSAAARSEVALAP